MSVGKKITEISAGDRAMELEQLLEITSDLGNLGDFDGFLHKIVVRAAEFLNFRRAAIAICEQGECIVRSLASNGTSKPIRLALPLALTQRLLAGGEPTVANELGALPELELETV